MRALTLAALCLLACPAGASAASVSVSETTGDVNQAALSFQAAAGEQNQLTAAYRPIAGGLAEYEIVDAGAVVTLEAGCTGGGAAAIPVICTMHAPRQAESQVCGKGCSLPVKGTAWSATMTVDLGDGDDSLEGFAVPGRYPTTVVQKVTGGDGKDLITTSGADDRIEPGPGDDIVHAGDGHDIALASTAPDGDDVYDLGEDNWDRVEYVARTGPVFLAGDVSGAPGEIDGLVGVEHVVGGSGDDNLVSDGTYAGLDGGPGNDLLAGDDGQNWMHGGPGNDILRGLAGNDQMSGGDGDDAYEAGDGEDWVIERPQKTEGDNLTLVQTTDGTTLGNDVADGGPGIDRIQLGPGEDRAAGGDGDDFLYGEGDPDYLDGGPGDDVVGGEAGSDQLLGGEGSDSLLAGLTNELKYTNLPRPVDTWTDSVDCGPDGDRARLNRWDRAINCEEEALVRAVKFRGAKYRKGSDKARLSLAFVGPGGFILLGSGKTRVGPILRPIAGAGPQLITMPILLRGRTLRAARRTGRLRMSLRVSFHPAEGPERAEAIRVPAAKR